MLFVESATFLSGQEMLTKWGPRKPLHFSWSAGMKIEKGCARTADDEAIETEWRPPGQIQRDFTGFYEFFHFTPYIGSVAGRQFTH